MQLGGAVVLNDRKQVSGSNMQKECNWQILGLPLGCHRVLDSASVRQKPPKSGAGGGGGGQSVYRLQDQDVRYTGGGGMRFAFFRIFRIFFAFSGQVP